MIDQDAYIKGYNKAVEECRVKWQKNAECWELLIGRINDLKENEDGTISFISRFYNGGTCLPEMLEEGLNKLNK